MTEPEATVWSFYLALGSSLAGGLTLLAGAIWGAIRVSRAPLDARLDRLERRADGLAEKLALVDKQAEEGRVETGHLSDGVRALESKVDDLTAEIRALRQPIWRLSAVLDQVARPGRPSAG